MVDVFDMTMNNLANAFKGGMIKRGQLFSGVREIEADLKEIKKVHDKLKGKDIPSGDAKAVIKDLKIEIDDIKDAEEKIIKCIGILLSDAYDLNKHIKELEMTEKELEKYKLEGIQQYEAMTLEAEKKLTEGLAKVAGIARREAV